MHHEQIRDYERDRRANHRLALTGSKSQDSLFGNARMPSEKALELL